MDHDNTTNSRCASCPRTGAQVKPEIHRNYTLTDQKNSIECISSLPRKADAVQGPLINVIQMRKEPSYGSD